ncbi:MULTISPECIES: LacI family DNA-binding transcriptional regulator [unclassified Mesorhizobium]|jgi:DNA-binding LacI/PurR family transcriptional regulator|uniref:LacI family DNA-binding transcriptional regulator n=1 Tax=unclassified Mesorhizobium TaxID=325217 RepID=UPI0008E44EB0|nr:MULTISPECIES: LacI family DNA-binding transcriptional regulator [unclassified Mesorhizobium]RJG46124.1 LacI family transcriptional regulator [Mesorhizobium sp. DCY119]SFU00767.1 transcriptional regulator, LacI family [Mesorhizobium sp. YR577]
MSDGTEAIGSKRPTIRDVAREAGVSIGTVSAVINGRGLVADDTKRHVLRFIAELGFEPNNAARSLKRGRISSIGFVVPDLGNPFFASVAEGIQHGIADNDILLMLCITWSKTEREEYFARVLRTQRLDGVIYLSGTGLPSPSLLELAKTGSVVFVDEVLPGLDVPFVGSNNLAGARAIARHVLDCGHRKIAIIGGPPRLWTSEQRLAGFRESLASVGLDPDAATYVSGDYSERSGYLAATNLLTGDPAARPTAILCANDLMAIGVMRFCRESGISIPGQLSITGFDDIANAEFLLPSLSTVAQPAQEMGRAAAELLLHRKGVRADPPVTTRFPTAVRIRNSVGSLK